MNIVFLGPPGSGKGTYASRIAPQLGIPHISTGDLLREAVAKKTPLGKKAESYMKKGALVPDDIIMQIVKERLGKKDARPGFIFDGFPRTIEQADSLERIRRVEIVINLKIPDFVIIQKILARRTCEKCGEIYNIAHIKFGKVNMPPVSPKKLGICDKCGGKLVSRSDETEQIIKDRLDVYRKQTQPLIDYYTKKKLLRNVDVIGSPEVMVPIIMAEIKKSKK
ncbi:MAG: adenylate kinase [Candidatus Aenigmarchaeota archaeon]|nr:adenylate kinase [Candidatus Aenigmarchaeota archaeon]